MLAFGVRVYIWVHRCPAVITSGGIASVSISSLLSAAKMRMPLNDLHTAYSNASYCSRGESSVGGIITAAGLQHCGLTHTYRASVPAC